MKKTIRLTGIIVLVIFLILIFLPFIFKDKIVSIVKDEINKTIRAKVDFQDADLSLFRHFPNLAFQLEGLHIVGTDEFEKDTLLSVKSLDLSLNLMSVIGGKSVQINSVELNSPRIFAIVNKEGKANWDIMKPDTAAADTSGGNKALSVHLKKYALHNGYIVYRDEQSRMSSKIVNLDHEGSGDFDAEKFTLSTSTTAGEVNFSYGGIPYLNKIKTSIDADFEVDAADNKYSFQTENIRMNDLVLAAGGFFRMAEDGYDMDIKFRSLSTDFKNILSFVPAVYQHNFSSVKTSGSLAFNGFVKGKYSDSQIPAYNLNLDIKDGFFQYPDLPKAVKNINLKATVNNPDGVPDHTTINIPRGHLEMDNNPFDFRLAIAKPLSDLFINAAAKGRLNLDGITDFVKLEKGTKLNGMLDADVAMKGSCTAVQKQKYDQFQAQGTIALKNFLYQSSDYPSGVRISDLLMTFNPRNVTLNKAAGNFLNTNFTADGTFNNILPYMVKNEPLDGTVNLSADHVDLNKWMGTSSENTADSSQGGPFVVPSNLDLQLNAKAGSVHYDKLDIKNLSGSLQIAGETVKLQNVKGNALDGEIGIDGYYSTRENKKKPDVSFSYDVKGVDIQKTFYAFNTVQKLMPVGKFLSGKLSSALSMKGSLGDDMMPDLSTLTGNGNVLLLEGFLNKFQPVESMAGALNISALSNFSVKDIKSYFEFAGGKVLVKPFNLKVKDIDMEIGGLHGLDQSLDYTINLKVPRAMMGEKGNALVNGLVSKANNKGIPVSVADKVDLQLKMEGTVTHPVIKTALKQSATNLAQEMKTQAAGFVQAKAEATKQAVASAVKDTVASVKKQLVQNAKAELAKKLTGAADTAAAGEQPAKKNLAETGKGLIKNLNPFKKKE